MTNINLYKENAKDFATRCHEGQTYGPDGDPYTIHLEKVVEYAEKYKHHINNVFERLDMMQAVWLHDVLEDCDVTFKELAIAFNHDVAYYVECVTDDAGANRKEKKRNSWWKIRRHHVGVFIKLCDRLANTPGRKVDMYRKEFPLFEAALYRPGQFDDMWDELRLMTFGDHEKYGFRKAVENIVDK